MKTIKKPMKFHDSAFRRFIAAALRLFIRTVACVEVCNPERIPPEGAFMFAVNHLSSYDAIVMQLVIQRMCCFMSKAELFSNPIAAWVLNRLGSFAVKRGEFDRQSMVNAKTVLEDGLVLMMFPEGTRTYGNGMIEARTGTAHLAMRNNCSILPVGMSGAEDILKHGLKKARVQINFGEMIVPGEHETAKQLTERMMRAIAALVPDKYRGFYA
jgi:1-acyl-sn-glycerol-3-phosphate acyltransferase